MALFEHPFLVLALGGLTNMILLALWLRSGEQRHRRALAAGLLITAGLVALSVLIVTPGERIARLCRQLGRLVDEGDVAAVGRHLDADFDSAGLDRGDFLERAAAALTRTRVDRVRLRDLDVRLDSAQRATATFGATANIRTADGFAGALPTRWRLHLVRRGDSWLVRKIESIPVPPLNLRDPREWLR